MVTSRPSPTNQLTGMLYEIIDSPRRKAFAGMFLILGVQITLYSLFCQPAWEYIEQPFDLRQTIILIPLITISLISFIIIERLAQLSIQKDLATTLENELAQQKEIGQVVQSHAQRLENQLQINQAILEEQSPKDIAKAAITHLRQMAGCQQASLVLFDFSTGTGTVLASSAEGKSAYADGDIIPMEQMRISEYLSGRETYVTEDIQTLNFKSETDQRLSVMGIRAYATTPLKVGGELIGIIALDRKEPGAFSKEHLAIAREAAASIAVALENTRLFSEARRRAEQLNALYETLREISGELELPKLLQAILKRAVELSNATSGELSLLEENSEHILIVASHNMGIDTTGRVMASNEGIMGKVIQSSEPLTIKDYAHWEARSHQYDYKNWKAVMAAPMLVSHKLVGVIAIVSEEPERIFTPTDLYLLDLFAQQAAVAVQNARLFGEVQKLAITDELTGIANRRQLFTLGKREFSRAQRFKRPLSAIMLDIDHFKQINDQYGHQAGDEVLRTMAQECLYAIRDIDIVARYGGEEFAVILPETRLPEAVIIAERLRKCVESRIMVTNKGPLQITISLGVTMRSATTKSLQDLLAQADEALYIAKNAGRNCVAASPD